MSLTQAVRSGDVVLVRHVLEEKGCDVNQVDELPGENEGQSPLMVACRNGYDDIVALLLTMQDLRVNEKDKNGETALYIASSLGHGNTVQQLLKHSNIQVNAQEKEGKTALYTASGLGHRDIVKALLDHPDIDVDVPSNSCDTAVTRATYDGQTDVVRLLVDSGKIRDINIQKKGKRNALCNACEKGCVEIAAFLLARNDVDDGDSPLLYTGMSGSVEIFHLLRKRPELHNINQQNRNGDTCLTFATKGGHVALVRALLQVRGIDVRLANNSSETALSIAKARQNTDLVSLFIRHESMSLAQAVRSGDLLLVRRVIEEKGCDVNEVEELPGKNDGFTPLMVACTNGFDDIVAFLLSVKDIRVNDKDKNGQTALYIASSLGHSTTVQVLLSHSNIQVNAQEKDGKTALYTASGLGHHDVVKILLNHPDIDADVPNNACDTAVTRATYDGQTDVVRTLVDSGKIRNINIQKKGKRNALCNACEKGRVDIAAFLLAREDDGDSPLLYTGMSGSVEIFHLLRKRPELHSINHQNHNGESCLTFATKGGHVDLVRALLQVRGIDIRLANNSLKTPLSIAMAQQNTELVSLLIRHLHTNGKFMNNELDEIFSSACSVGLADIAQWIVEQDTINLHLDVASALLAAVKYGHAEVVGILLRAYGLHASIEEDSRNTALHRALESNQLAIAELFAANDVPNIPLHYKENLLIEHLAPHLTVASSLNLIMQDFPLQYTDDDMLVPSTQTSFSWPTFLDSSVKIDPIVRMETIERLLDHPKFATVTRKSELVRQLAFSKDQQGREALNTTDATTRDFLKGLIHFCGRYEIFDGPPIHVSPTAVVVNAYDHGICLQVFKMNAMHDQLNEKGFIACNQGLGRVFTERSANQKKFQRDAEAWRKEFQIWDKDRNGTMSEVEFLHYCRQYFGGKIKVAMKFMRNADEHERESESRKGLAADFVLPTLPTLDQNVFWKHVKKLKINDELDMTEYPHVLVMPAANRSLEDIHLKERPSDAKVRSMLYEVAVALKHLHEKNRVHGDLKKLNVLRVQSALKLIDLDAAAKMGDAVGAKFSSGILPPEMFYKLKSNDEVEQYKSYWNSAMAVPSRWNKLKPKNNYVVKSFRHDCTSADVLPYDIVQATPAIDLWALGCLMYQMVCGAELVATDLNQDVVSDRMAEAASWTAEKLMRRIETNIPNESALDLVSKLLVVNPTERLSLDHVLAHEYFSGVVNWEPMRQKVEVIMVNDGRLHDQVDQLVSAVAETTRLQHKAKENIQVQLNQATEGVMCGLMEAQDVLVPTSFVLLPFKVEENTTRGRENNAIDFCKRLMQSGKAVKVANAANKHLGDALAGLTSDKTLYLYLIDEVTGEVVANDPNGVYPIAIPTSNIAFLATAMPWIQGGLLFLKSVKGVSGMMKSFGVPSVPDMAGLKSISEALGEPTCTFGVLRDAVPDVPVESIRGAALRELTHVFEKWDEDRTFGGLERAILENGRVVWTNHEAAKDIRERKR
ncbi:hypothetical protein As57867_009302, partial [Aphanomyces stellatus]